MHGILPSLATVVYGQDTVEVVRSRNDTVVAEMLNISGPTGIEAAWGPNCSTYLWLDLHSSVDSILSANKAPE